MRFLRKPSFNQACLLSIILSMNIPKQSPLAFAAKRALVISFFIFLNSGAGAETMIFKLRSSGPLMPTAARLGDKQASHDLVVEHLIADATLSQADIVSQLAQLERQGQVESYKRFWIINAIEVTAEQSILEALKNRADVEYWTEIVPVELIAPVQSGEAPPINVGHEIGLGIIGATTAWAQGIDGTGSIVCNFDTGVDADHPALHSKYRGNNGHPAGECWFDPSAEHPYPFDLQGHGTHTMGIMLGSDGGDTVGVAPGAQWIAARAVGGGGVTRTIGDLLSAFQWAADPDGNPQTTQDVPDVVNNSWGIPAGYFPACDQTFWEAVDNLEAAGVVAVFGAGNEGPGAETIRTPANRIASAFNCFAVGAVLADGDTVEVADFSSRGPSECDHITVKPEVTAPGVAIRSSHLGGGYLILSGTSMSTPHVAGAVALLRQINPNATPDEIKAALVNSAIDFGAQGEDNSYGWGVIDIMAAIYLLPGSTPTIGDGLPRTAGLLTNYPNPFNGGTVITSADYAGLGNYVAIYDIYGRLIRRLFAGGGPIVIWDGLDEVGRRMATGVYFARPEGIDAQSRRMILIK